MADLPAKARAVIIGGGVIGCSVAYHLTKLGWTDVVLLERKQLTCGTTWHAAGLIAQLRATHTMTNLAKYTQELYFGLEEETGVATGIKRNGSITVALTDERMEELRRQLSMARAFGVEVEEISLKEIAERYEHLNLEGAVGGVYLDKDGQGDPANIALALAKGARSRGAKIIEGVKVTGVTRKDGRATGVTTAQGNIEADFVVNCAGMWGREVGRMAGVNVPLQACEHFYIVTEAIPGLTQLPVLRVPDECAYYKEDAGKMLLGAFEPNAKPWGMDGIPEDFCFDQLAEDFDHFEPILEMAVNRMPMLGEAGIHTFFNGPESFTPDDRYLLGEAPECRNFFVAAGFNSIGIQSAGGAGMALAQWMEDGQAPFDLVDVDIRRMQPFQNTKHYLVERATEALGLLYADHFPYRQFETARNIRRSPLHAHLEKAGAVFGETAGWERANWFAKEGQKREYEYSWGRQNWFANAAAEHKAVREDVGLFDMSSFGKLRVQGPDAQDVLQRICGADVAVPPGKIVYTQFLNPRGGIEADVTVTRLAEDDFLVVTPAATALRDLTWIKRHTPEEARVGILDVTPMEAVIVVMGPRAREVLQPLTTADLSNEAFPFGTMQEIEFGMAPIRAHRVTYVGELGWELYVSAEMAGYVYERLMGLDAAPDLIRHLDRQGAMARSPGSGAGAAIRHCGLHVLDSCRIEKAFRHFGHDIADEDHVLEAGLGFAVKTDKQPSKFGDMIGRDAVLSKRQTGLAKRMMQFKLNDPQPLLYHNEAIRRDGEVVGYITSGNYGHHLGGAIGMGYVPCAEPGEKPADMLASTYEIEVAGTRVPTTASLKPMYDPKSERVKV